MYFKIIFFKMQGNTFHRATAIFQKKQLGDACAYKHPFSIAQKSNSKIGIRRCASGQRLFPYLLDLGNGFCQGNAQAPIAGFGD